MDRSHRQFHLTPTRTVIFAIFPIATVLLLLLRTPNKFRSNLINAPPLFHTFAMSNTTAWIQSRLTSLYEATDASFHDAFDQAFSPACEVRLNHAVHPLQMLKDDLVSRRTAATHVSVAWNTDVISTNDDKPDQVRAATEIFGHCLADGNDGGSINDDNEYE